MPGIAGIISRRPAGKCEQMVRDMVAIMAHEPFYKTGTFFVPELGIYAGWVALDGSFAAEQVFVNEQRDVALIFSGECFMDPDVCRNLRRNGHHLRENRNDWLVHLYEDQGEHFFERLNGLFSGLLIDKRHQRLVLFNDRYGAERIYWSERDGDFYFASEAKALLRVIPELRGFDRKGVAQFLTYGCTLEDRTLFRDIQLLPVGSAWSFEAGRCRKRKYFDPAGWESQTILCGRDFGAELEATLTRVLPRYFESSSKTGISLTGGLDSRMIMACYPHRRDNSICYTFSGEARKTLDDRLAARVAEACGLEHHLLRIHADFFSDFADHVDRAVFKTDGCFGATGAHEIYLNRQARQLAPVRVTGNCGSEILRGTCTFKPIGLSPELSEMSYSDDSNSTYRLMRDQLHPVTFAAFRELPWSLFGSLCASRSQTDLRMPFLDNELVALAYRCPDHLRRSPQIALSVINNRSAALGNIPTDMGFGTNRLTAALRFAFFRTTFKLDYFNNEGLPDWLAPFDSAFQKIGFGTGLLGQHKYLHYRTWFREKLAGYLHDVVAEIRARRSPLWDSALLQKMVTAHTDGWRNYVLEINAVLTLEAVERLFFRDLGDPNRESDKTPMTVSASAVA